MHVFRSRWSVLRALAACAVAGSFTMLLQSGPAGATGPHLGGTSDAADWRLQMAARAHDPGCGVVEQGHSQCDLKVLKASAGPTATTTCTVNAKDGYSACNIQKAYVLTT